MKLNKNIIPNPIYNDQYFLDLYGISDLDEKVKPYRFTYRKSIENDKLNVAYHEAGHAVLGVLFDYYIAQCQIFPSNCRTFLKEHSWGGNCSFYPQPLNEDFAVFSAGGKVAELIKAGKWQDTSDLLMHCYDIEDLEEMGFSPSDMDGISVSDNIEETFHEAHRLVSEHWSMVERVSEALLKQYVVTYEELIDFLDDSNETQKGA